MNELKLDRNIDPTVFARCPRCTRHYNGKPVTEWFAKAYPPAKWQRGPQTCDNCGTKMEFMYEVL